MTDQNHLHGIEDMATRLRVEAEHLEQLAQEGRSDRLQGREPEVVEGLTLFDRMRDRAETISGILARTQVLLYRA